MRLVKVDEIPETAKTILVRVDYNVPLLDGKITDETRIIESLPTLNWLLDRKKRVVLVTHLGRPEGKLRDDWRVDPIAGRLAELLDRPVCVVRQKPGKQAASQIKALPPGEVALLENIRFYPEEEAGDAQFSEALAEAADAFVNEAFSVSHRAHASVVGVTRFLPAFAGFHLAREVEQLSRIRDTVERPFALILGGKKLRDKIPLVERFIGGADVFIFGGGVGNTFAKARGWSGGESLVDTENLDRAQSLLDQARASGARIIVPTDFVYESADGELHHSRLEDFPTNGFAGDIGEKTREAACDALAGVRSVFWNGPLGIVEKKGFEQGSLAVLNALRRLKAYRVAGGGDTLAMIRQFSMEDAFDYLSSAGGAAIEFLSGQTLPGIAPLWKA